MQRCIAPLTPKSVVVVDKRFGVLSSQPHAECSDPLLAQKGKSDDYVTDLGGRVWRGY